MNPPPILSRRAFIKASALGAGATIASRFVPSAWARLAGANDALRIGIIGLHNKGGDHLRDLLKRADVRVVGICDLDPKILALVLEQLKAQQVAPFATTEARELLARPDIDAVVIATPNHWHALLTLWACQAGKDVYVEKPMCHTVWEGRKMVEAGAKYGRVVQVGTQHRSDPGLLAAAKYLQEGHCGKMLYVHAVYYNLRKDIGYRLPWYPDWLNYNAYCGPAPMTPLGGPTSLRLALDMGHGTATLGTTASICLIRRSSSRAIMPPRAGSWVLGGGTWSATARRPRTR